MRLKVGVCVVQLLLLIYIAIHFITSWKVLLRIHRLLVVTLLLLKAVVESFYLRLILLLLLMHQKLLKLLFIFIYRSCICLLVLICDQLRLHLGEGLIFDVRFVKCLIMQYFKNFLFSIGLNRRHLINFNYRFLLVDIADNILGFIDLVRTF